MSSLFVMCGGTYAFLLPCPGPWTSTAPSSSLAFVCVCVCPHGASARRVRPSARSVYVFSELAHMGEGGEKGGEGQGGEGGRRGKGSVSRAELRLAEHCWSEAEAGARLVTTHTHNVCTYTYLRIFICVYIYIHTHAFMHFVDGYVCVCSCVCEREGDVCTVQAADIPHNAEALLFCSVEDCWMRAGSINPEALNVMKSGLPVVGHVMVTS